MAVCVAVFAHLAVLAIRISSPEFSQLKESPLSISFLPEPTFQAREQEQTLPELRDEPVAPPKPTPLPVVVSDTILTDKSGSQAEPRLLIQTSPNSASFQRWLQDETDNFSEKNPQAVGKFKDTFTPSERYESPPELSPFNGNPVLAGNGVFATELNGKRTCYVEIMNLSDVTAGSSFTSKDCTPPKKFELNINKPNNGWTDR